MLFITIFKFCINFCYKLSKKLKSKVNKLIKLITLKNFQINFFYYIKSLVFNLNLPSLLYIQGLFIILLIDCCLMDDEPLWEPIEWTMIQSWLLFFFIFSWISETIISSRYGSFTGRDKRVYTGLFKAFWYIEMWFNFNMFLTCIFIIVPFYFELSYTVSYVVTWWQWYNRLFFFKFILIWIIIDFINSIVIHGIKWLNFKKLFILCNVITILLFYLFFIQFIVTYFSYFTDSLWYKKTSWCDFNRLSHNPQKWGWGGYDRDHFNYHKTTLSFWFKNDALYASAFFFINMINFLLLSLTILQWLLIVRQIYTTKSISYTFITYGFSTLNMYFVTVFSLFFFVILSVIYQFIRTSSDFLWVIFKTNFIDILLINLNFI